MTSDAADPRNWRDILRSIAWVTRQAAQRHPWFVDLLGGRPNQGPSALAHLERLLAALHASPGFEDIDAVMQAAKTINAYVIGVIRSEAGAVLAERESGMDKAAWQSASWSYMQRGIATGLFPTLAKVIRDAPRRPMSCSIKAWIVYSTVSRPGGKARSVRCSRPAQLQLVRFRGSATIVLYYAALATWLPSRGRLRRSARVA